MPPETEVAWAAGFYDGEGCATISGDNPAYLQVKQVDERGIRRFHAAVDGIGSIYGPYSSRRASPIFVWRATGERALSVIEILWPYLGEAKKEQWRRVFDQWDARRLGGDRCRNGHLFTEENPAEHGDGRYCRTCRTETYKRYDAKRSPRKRRRQAAAA